ncbi:23S rRNA (uracil(1939)-C(5))-methyltransferase RlmD [Treponema zioleckii]|uniref:23S rRNA (uracil(1939)-C(5))-methyltransferase RlmD n=1 Tax=Treponema zioleckii TaxID=331680 RepID=UPI00168A9C02|nr:23S rRNA (uracil(1939)-C(5))-methyltransferase RlmD [Treponema zioleckii]
MAGQIIKVEKMVAGGNCIGRLNGKNVFVPYAVPGETLEVEITKSFRDYDLARIVRVLEPSSHRIEPFCPLYGGDEGKCGGCNMQHIDYEFQKKLRAEILRDCFEREGLTSPEIEIISADEKNYRSRIQLTDGGFNSKESNSVVNLSNCPVATNEINSYLAMTSQNERPSGRVHIFGDRRVLNAQNEKFANVVVADEDEVYSSVGKVSGAGKNRLNKVKNNLNHRFMGTRQNSENVCSVTLKGKKIDFDVKGFFQSNLDVLEKTIDAVCYNMGGKNVLDMYAGCGTFSVFLSDIFEKTFLVEHNRDALVFAEMNLAGKKHESYGQSGEKWVLQNARNVILNNGNFDAVVIDPPRSGMEKQVCKWLCENKVGQIRSVSCNPSTHARDAKFLVKSGYILSKLYLLDFYPQTSHIESLAFFEYYA